MKWLLPLSIMGASAAFAATNLDLWTDQDEIEHYYLDQNWLGGDLEINAVENPDFEGKLELRVKLTGAGSIPRTQSEYYVTDVEQNSELPLRSRLIKSTSNWERLPIPSSSAIVIEQGDRTELGGKFQGYSFKAPVVEVAEDTEE